MTKKEFRELAERRLMFLDGATGSNLQKSGMPTGVCPEQWIMENPESLCRKAIFMNTVIPVWILRMRSC